jgi:hypothetical protein
MSSFDFHSGLPLPEDVPPDAYALVCRDRHGGAHAFLVDSFLFPEVSRWRWNVDRDGYAYRRTSKRIPGRPKPVGCRRYLHREVQRLLGRAPPAGLTVDHVNRKRGDCRGSNLENVTQSVNTHRMWAAKKNPEVGDG